ncbi:hypothetical protein [Rufibacter ruber]|uniref:hypothetical protein n=1 Tax=Rufibacter ruber TaxID=1783499 RepID=UPI000B334130|nr:hypothetical protein [Rufibacter ruber]
MKNIYYLSNLLLLTWLLTGCEKEELPKPTQNGSGIIACKVNGKPWIAEIKSLFANGEKFYVNYGANKSPKRFVLGARRTTDDHNSRIEIALEDLRTTGIQQLNFDTYSYPGNLSFKNYGGHNDYNDFRAEKDFLTNTRHTRAVNITRLDTVQRIVSGTIYFTAENLSGTGETVNVTDGRFDVKY